MPIQPLHHVSGQESQNPHPSTEFCILTSGFSPIMRNEPNLHPPIAYCLMPGACILQNEPNLSPANSQSPTAKSYFYKTNPICAPLVPHAYCLVPKFHEMNPIPARPTANRQQPKATFCETNPIPAYQVSRRPLFQRNEPNLPPQPPYRWRLAGFPMPDYTKRTQFTPTSTCPTQKMRNEPCAKLSWCNSAGLILPGQRLAARPE